MSNQKKIALVGFRLSEGGADRVMANLSNYFHNQELDVHIIIFHDAMGYSYSGKVFNLGKLKSETNGAFNKIKRFYHFNKYIKKHDFDFIIDFRFRINVLQELLISKWIYNTKTIYTVHSSKLDVYMPNNSTLTKWIYGKKYAILSITKEMQKTITETHNLKNVTNIYNPINVDEISVLSQEKIELDFEFIIAAGEYDKNTKQFDKLIEAYSKSILPQEKIALVIIGNGKQKDFLLSVAERCGVKDFVHLIGFKANPYKYFGKARFLVLSSKFEGLPMVLLEALACGTPIVAFDCPTGPKEIIQHKENGLLVENQNITELTKGMNTLIQDVELYKKCKLSAQSSLNKFSVDSIGDKWMELMNIR